MTAYSLLVVDDEKVIRDGIARILARESHLLTLVENGRQAWQCLQERTFDLILLDLMMPEMSGLELLARLKEKIPDPIVIIITGHATVELAVEAMKQGAYDLVTKPFTPDQLRLVVRRALDKRALQIEAERLRREREKSLKDIAAEKSRLRTILHSMAGGVLVTDRDRNVALFNPAFTHLLKLEAPLLTARPLPDTESLRNLDEALAQVLPDTPGTPPAVSREFTVAGDPPVFLRSHTAAVRGADAEILGAVTVVQDITYLKVLDRMKNEFVAMVAHELRSPLAAVRQQVEVVLQGLAGPVNEKQRELLSRARERVGGLLDLIGNLLDISKMEAEGHLTQKEVLCPGPVAEKAVTLLRPQAETKGQRLELELAPDLPAVLADPQGLEEILINLIQNAVKYTPEGGNIRVCLQPEAEYLLIRVSDTGIGIEAADLTRIFDKFYRVKNERTRKIVGTGLGLPIVKRIVEAHLGYIEVRSEINRGTDFKVLLPRSPRA